MTAYPRPIVLANESQLQEYLDNLRDIGHDPLVAGMDCEGNSFLAQYASLNGEPLYEVVWENPVYTKKDTKRDGNPTVCKKCFSDTERYPTSDICFPATVLTLDIDQLMPTPDETGEPVVEQPPPVDELLAEVEADEDKPGKGNNK